MPDWVVLLGVLGEMPVLQAVLWLVAVGLFIGLVVKMWPYLWNSVQIVNALLKLPAIAAQLPQLAQQVKDIHHETHRNDGSSLKDAVSRIEDSVGGLHGRMDMVEKDVGGIRQETSTLRDVDLDQGRKVDALDDKLDQHLTETADLIAYVRNKKEKDQ